MTGMESVKEEPEQFFPSLLGAIQRQLDVGLFKPQSGHARRATQGPAAVPCSYASVHPEGLTRRLVIGAGWHPQRGKGSTLFWFVGLHHKSGMLLSP